MRYMRTKPSSLLYEAVSTHLGVDLSEEVELELPLLGRDALVSVTSLGVELKASLGEVELRLGHRGKVGHVDGEHDDVLWGSQMNAEGVAQIGAKRVRGRS